MCNAFRAKKARTEHIEKIQPPKDVLENVFESETLDQEPEEESAE